MDSRSKWFDPQKLNNEAFIEDLDNSNYMHLKIEVWTKALNLVGQSCPIFPIEQDMPPSHLVLALRIEDISRRAD